MNIMIEVKKRTESGVVHHHTIENEVEIPYGGDREDLSPEIYHRLLLKLDYESLLSEACGDPLVECQARTTVEGISYAVEYKVVADATQPDTK